MARSEFDRTGIAAVRGAVPVRANRSDDIIAATARLLTRLLEVNRLAREQIVSAIFTATDDLDADFPAHAARKLGWTDVPRRGARGAPPARLPGRGGGAEARPGGRDAGGGRGREAGWRNGAGRGARRDLSLAG